MAVQYNSDSNSFSTIFDGLIGKISPVKKEIKEFFELANAKGIPLNEWSKVCNNVFDDLCKEFKVTDSELKNFLRTWDGSGDISEAFTAHMKQSTESMTLFQRGAKAAGMAFKTVVAAVGSMAITFAISEVISIISELITSSDRLAEKAQDLGAEFKNTETDISNYKDKIQELNDKINDSSTPYDEVVQARQDLMKIQNEMIKKYGDEEGAIKSITNAVKGQADAFNELNTQQYNKMINDFNKNEKIGDKIKSAFKGSNFEQMKKNEKSYSDKIDMSYNSELDNYIKSLGGSDEFTAHAQVIAEDLAYIVQNGGYMADQIASTMGTTTSEIANSLTNSVDNQALASQAIAGNTNASIEQMANAVSTLFAELGNQIGNFKATINFAPKVNGVEHFSAIKIGGKEIVGGDIPNLTYDIKGSSSSLKSIGSAISSFGKVLSSNIAAQKVDYKKFSTTPTDSSGKQRSYTPSKGVSWTTV